MGSDRFLTTVTHDVVTDINDNSVIHRESKGCSNHFETKWSRIAHHCPALSTCDTPLV